VLDAKTFSLCTPTFTLPFLSIAYQEDNKKKKGIKAKKQNKKKPKQERVESLFD
jgi:hypothetical protein